MDDEEFRIVVSALLHDLGKFYMRTHSVEECLGKKTGEKLTHEELLNRVKGKVGLNIGEGLSINIKDEYVKLGDWISAQEREEYEREISREEIKDVREKPLISIFSLVTLNKNETMEMGLKHKNLSLELPREDNFVFDGFKEELYDGFKTEFEKISKCTEKEKRREYIKKILSLMKKYLITIPSASYYAKPTIDLYHHSKSSAAIALCLYRYFKNDNKSKEELIEVIKKYFERKKSVNEEELDKLYEEMKRDPTYTKKCFLLVKGDMSGIQDFISTISTDKAMKTLKGRSFYLSTLNKLIALKLLEKLDLPETNLIYSSGGTFELICDNSKSNKEKINEFIQEVNRKLFDLFRIKIFIAIGYKEMSPLDFDSKIFKDFISGNEEEWIMVSDKLRKFDFILEKKGFEIEKAGIDECSICKAEIEEKKENCDLCEKFIDLRDYIKKCQINKRIKSLKGYKDIFLFDDIDELIYAEHSYLNKIEGIFDIFPTGLVLEENNNVKELDEIVKISGSEEKKKIAALKFDLDNLGEIFKNGLGESLTLSTYSRLSFYISLFFEGIINTIWENKYKDKVILIYSGGDDGFVVGECFAVLDFAKDLYNYFKIFVGKHQDFNISAAYGVYDVKYPIKKIFENLEDQLKKAKEEDKEKNKICLNGEVLRWNYFDNFTESIFEGKYEEPGIEDLEKNDFEFMVKLTNYFLKLIKEEKMSSVMLHRIIEMSSNTIEKLNTNIENKKKEKIVPNVYGMRYLLVRNIKEDKKVCEKLYKLWEKSILRMPLTKNGISEAIYKMRCFKVASQLAELYNRYEEGVVKNESK
ncbi:MAG: type III-A CRISPR-associated protein Cas10/Csm1 [Candidatus Parvarchaeota archaeon]|nr:type III-A CRISPR-associated protein Cas10/Csm1 [Candidatus Jingweiarchaeum tengchongense]